MGSFVDTTRGRSDISNKLLENSMCSPDNTHESFDRMGYQNVNYLNPNFTCGDQNNDLLTKLDIIQNSDKKVRYFNKAIRQ